jgi:hypothetical protein
MSSLGTTKTNSMRARVRKRFAAGVEHLFFLGE